MARTFQDLVKMVRENGIGDNEPCQPSQLDNPPKTMHELHCRLKERQIREQNMIRQYEKNRKKRDSRNLDLNHKSRWSRRFALMDISPFDQLIK